MTDVTVQFDARVYRLSAAKKAAYRLGDRCFARIDLLPDGLIRVVLTPKSAGTSPPLLEGEFWNELLDQELREAISEETVGVRNLLLAQAFSGLETGPDSADFREDPMHFGRTQVEGQ